MHSRTVRVSMILAAALAAASTSALAAPLEPTYGKATPEAARAALNREQATKARLQLADNAASQAAYEAAQAAREEQIRTDQAAWEAEKTRLATEHEAAMAQWRADVAACRAGDETKCRH